MATEDILAERGIFREPVLTLDGLRECTMEGATGPVTSMRTTNSGIARGKADGIMLYICGREDNTDVKQLVGYVEYRKSRGDPVSPTLEDLHDKWNASQQANVHIESEQLTPTPERKSTIFDDDRAVEELERQAAETERIADKLEAEEKEKGKAHLAVEAEEEQMRAVRQLRYEAAEKRLREAKERVSDLRARSVVEEQ